MIVIPDTIRNLWSSKIVNHVQDDHCKKIFSFHDCRVTPCIQIQLSAITAIYIHTIFIFGVIKGKSYCERTSLITLTISSILYGFAITPLNPYSL